LSLDRYEVQARLIADELLDLLMAAERKSVARILKAGEPDYAQMNKAAFDQAIALFSATPAKRKTLWDRVPAEDRPLLWLRARMLALASAKALQMTIDVQRVERTGYREAVREIARSALPTPLWPTAEEMLVPAY
jgi:hypothetical protein